MSGFREKALRTDGRTHGQTRLLRSQRPVGRETKNQTIPVHQFEKNWENIVFEGIKGIKGD